ncbi:GNAT family N-acetyltransferase [Roseivivax sp. CAU 1761]
MSAAAIALRPARPTDAGRLGALLTEAVAGPGWKPRLRSGAEDIAEAGRMIDFGWVSVAEDRRGRILGFLAREGGYVHALIVAAEAQGRGIGRQLVAAAKAEAPELRLWTFARNRRARRFYEREGFAEIARGDGRGTDEGLADVQFRWRRAAG